MKILKSILFIGILFAVISINWNCGNDQVLNPVSQKNGDRLTDESNSTFSVTITYKIYQLFSSTGCGNTEYKIFETTNTYSVPPNPNPSYLIHTMSSSYRGDCGTETCYGWRVEKYVTWTDCGPNKVAFWDTPSGTYYKELIPTSGGPYSFSHVANYTGWAYNAYTTINWGITGFQEQED